MELFVFILFVLLLLLLLLVLLVEVVVENTSTSCTDRKTHYSAYAVRR